MYQGMCLQTVRWKKVHNSLESPRWQRAAESCGLLGFMSDITDSKFSQKRRGMKSFVETFYSS